MQRSHAQFGRRQNEGKSSSTAASFVPAKRGRTRTAAGCVPSSVGWHSTSCHDPSAGFLAVEVRAFARSNTLVWQQKEISAVLLIQHFYRTLRQKVLMTTYEAALSIQLSWRRTKARCRFHVRSNSVTFDPRTARTFVLWISGGGIGRNPSRCIRRQTDRY